VPARFRREMRTIYFAPFLAMAALAAIVLWAVESQISSVSWVEHTDRVIRRTKDAQIDLRDMAVAIRSYWLVPDKKYLAEFEKADRQLSANLAAVSALVGDNPAQEQRALEVSNLKGTWIGEVQALMAQPNAGAAAIARLDQMSARSQEASNLLDQITDHEDQLLRHRTSQQHRGEQLIFVLVLFLSISAATVLAYFGWREIERASKKFAEAVAKEVEASQAKDYFLATVSHELRNPLNSILLLVGILLADSGIDESARQRVRGIDRAARSQAQLIEDLLDVSRIESGRMRLDVQATDLAKVVTAAADTMRLAAEAKSITLTEIIDNSINLIAGDPKRLEQVVWNLLSNAIKFTPKGGKVQVRLERINSHVEIIVTDNGQGIGPSSLPSIFDRFWREAEGTQRSPGVGLGLSIVKELVALHGGTVIAHSEGIGKGSTFTVRLPVPPATAPLLEPRRHPTVASADDGVAAARLDGLSIMVVDDDPEACEALSKLLASLGAKVSADDSAQNALTSLDGARPDVIIADIGMPVHDGFFFAHELRKREQNQKGGGRVPLIALTAFGRVDDKVKILGSGFDSHVVKPVDLAELAAIVRSLVAARAA
jgi:signal transduction histidine kinase/ActR/RegA family two-component response regulator